MTRVLVTGADGFIGRHLLPELRSRGHELVIVSSAHGDIAHKSTWRGFPKAGVVIHLAARSFVPDSWHHPSEFVQVNVLGTNHALEYCRAHGARLVFLSSYLYGDPRRLPVDEQSPVVATNPYAFSKALAENVCSFYWEQFGVDVNVLRLFNVYGVGQARNFLIPSILEQLRAGCEIRVKDLAPKRDYVYVRDVATAIAAASAKWCGYRVFNVGSGVSHSVEDLISTIQEIWGSQLPVVSSHERREGEIMETIADISRARKELGWNPLYTLRKGLAETYMTTVGL